MEGVELWLVQAECLSHYQANVSEEGVYRAQDTNDLLGKGDVMHLTCVTKDGESVAVFVPGAHRRMVFHVLDNQLMLDDVLQYAKRREFNLTMVTGVIETKTAYISDGEPSQFFVLSMAAHNAYKVREAREQIAERFEGLLEACEEIYTAEAQFVDDHDIGFSKWFRMGDAYKCMAAEHKTRETAEYICEASSIISAPFLDGKPPPPCKIVSFDIETRNSVWNETDVPKFDNPDSSIYSVAITAHTLGVISEKGADYAYYVLVRPPNAPADFTPEYLLQHTKFDDVTLVENENQLLERLNDIFVAENPVFITGHNILAYDLPFVLGRGSARSRRWSRRKNHIITFRPIQRDSGAMGKNDTFVYKCQRIVVDVYPYIRENKNGLDDYKLDTIAKAILPQTDGGQKKVPLRYEDQFNMYMFSDCLEDHLLLAEYVYTDAVLCPEIMRVFSAFEKLISASIVAETPLEKMLGGQQTRAYHAIVREGHRLGFYANPMPDLQISSYMGGFVQKPTPQVVIPFEHEGRRYFETTVTLDFKSLYPNLMRQFAICYTNLITGKPYERLVAAYEAAELSTEGATFLKRAQASQKACSAASKKAKFESARKNDAKKIGDLEISLSYYKQALDVVEPHMEEDEPFLETCRANFLAAEELKNTEVLEVPLEYHLVCFRNRDGSIFKTLVDRYMTERGRYKKLIKAAERKKELADTDEDIIKYATEAGHADSAQLAVKVMINSIYGFTGMKPPKAAMPVVVAAATTTCAGRWAIKQTLKMSQTNHTIEAPRGKSPPLLVHFTTDFDDLKEWENTEDEVVVFTDMVYGDTDSIMPRIRYKQPCVLDDRDLFEAVMEVENDRINKELRQVCADMGYDRPYLILEFEKHGPMLIKAPKMYALYKHVPGKTPKLDKAGLKSKRRDTAPVLCVLFDGILEKILIHNDLPGAVMLIYEFLENVKSNAFPLEDYYIGTSIGRAYKNPNLLQPTLQKKIRAKGGICDPGTRVYYVVCKGVGSVAEKAESPTHITLDDVDRLWYTKNHIQKSILELLEVAGQKHAENIKHMFVCACHFMRAQSGKQSQLTSFFKKLPSKRKDESL